MYIYVRWKINMDLYNKLEILEISKNPDPNTVFDKAIKPWLAFIPVDEDFNPNRIYYSRIELYNVKDADKIKLYFLLRESIKNDKLSEMNVHVFMGLTPRTKEIEWIMRNTDTWDKKKLNILKKNKTIEHEYMFDYRIVFNILDLHVEL